MHGFYARTTPAARPLFRALFRGGLVGCLMVSLSAGCAVAGRSGGGAVNPSATAGSPAATSSPATRAALPDPAKVQANELGVVPVLMYHQIIPDPRSVYGRTPRAFRAELERLAREGYVPVTAREYATGKIDIPAGKHPVVLTFDDSTTSQFRLASNGKPAPNTAVAILLDVAREYPQFRPAATMYVNGEPFGGGDDGGSRRALRWLHGHGFEIGNHTIGHANLGAASATEVQQQVAECHEMITSTVPGVEVGTLALPFGAQPDNAELAIHGSSGGTTYDYGGAFLVGAGPAPSPYSAGFEPSAIPRIRSQGDSGQGAELGSTAWLDKLAEHPEMRYTADGDPRHVSFPEGADAEPAGAAEKRARPY